MTYWKNIILFEITSELILKTNLIGNLFIAKKIENQSKISR